MNTCEDCESEIIYGLGCDCGNYPPEQDRVADHVEQRTGIRIER